MEAKRQYQKCPFCFPFTQIRQKELLQTVKRSTAMVHSPGQHVTRWAVHYVCFSAAVASQERVLLSCIPLLTFLQVPPSSRSTFPSYPWAVSTCPPTHSSRTTTDSSLSRPYAILLLAHLSVLHLCVLASGSQRGHTPHRGAI